MSNEPNAHENAHPEPHVDIKVVTTSGSYPVDGFDEVPVRQKVRIELDKAAKKLNLTDTSGWVATVDGREINIDQSYQDNGLTGKAVIDWGPNEGGGGRE